MSLRCVLPVALAVLAAACRGPSRPVPPEPLVAREVVELERHEVLGGGGLLGYAVKFAIQDPAGTVVFWRFVNTNGAWLGHATEQGRFSRRVPFRDGEEDLGMWPMRQGVARLFEVDDARLREVTQAVPAAAPKTEPPQPVEPDRR